MEIKLNVAHTDGKTTTLTLEDGKALHGVKIGETFKGERIDKTGYEFTLTGGSDNAGFPMRRDVDGDGRRKILVAGGVGFKPKRKGMRVRKTMAGNTVGPRTAQLNVTLTKEGKEPLVAPPAAAEEAPAEEAAE